MVLFMLFMTVLLMGTMIGFGWLFLKNIPRKPQALFGYRSKWSMKSEETWAFAHAFSGKIWLYSGFFGLVLSAGWIFWVKDHEEVENLALYLFYGQMVLLLLVIPWTEYALRKQFDEDGHRKEPK
ncbi:MAG TPA: hypothetical protein DEA52_02085 [Clostridiaceae bacterium]|nr:hypothetical protein [Clostridiaceae bacterium]